MIILGENTIYSKSSYKNLRENSIQNDIIIIRRQNLLKISHTDLKTVNRIFHSLRKFVFRVLEGEIAQQLGWSVLESDFDAGPRTLAIQKIEPMEFRF